MKIVFCAPKFDAATEYSYAWALELQAYAQQKGHECIILNIQDAIKEKVEDALKNNPAALWCHYDHGNEDCVWGNDERHVIDLTNNSLLQNRECYNMNCLSAKTLGADSYLRYNAIYWGSYEVISFTTDALDEFKRVMNYGFKLRIDGEIDWNIMMEKTLINDNAIIDELISKGKIFAAALLREDRDARRVWTNQTPPPDQPSQCTFRRAALKLFGQKAWRIPSLQTVARYLNFY